MADFKTLQFPSTPAGQAEKIRALKEHSMGGWRVVSETLQPATTDASDACSAACAGLFCCGPWGVMKGLEAGRKGGTITVTLTRE